MPPNISYDLSTKAIAQATELALIDFGLAVAGSNVTAQDLTKHWVVNEWAGGEIKVIKPNGNQYTSTIASNTLNTITFAALPAGVAVEAGDVYSIRTQGAALDVSDRWNRQLGKIDLQRVLGADLAHANPVIVRLTTGAAFEVDLPTLARLQRWGRDVTPAWVYAAEQLGPAALTNLVTQTVGAGVVGYIYGFFISCGEANDFFINWTSGGAPYTRRIIFGGAGFVQDVEMVALNDGLPADTGTDITIQNFNIGGGAINYQANLLYAEV